MWSGTAVEPPGTRLLLSTQLLCLRPTLLAPSTMWLGMLSLSRAGNCEQSVMQVVVQAMLPTEHRSEYRLECSAEYRIETLKIICCNGGQWEREQETQGTRISSRTGVGGRPTDDRRTPDRGRAGAGQRTGGCRAEDRRAQGGGQAGHRAEDKAGQGGGQGRCRTEDKRAPGGGQGGPGRRTGRTPDRGRADAGWRRRRALGGGQGGRLTEDGHTSGGGQTGAGRRTGGRPEDGRAPGRVQMVQNS